MRRTTPGLLLCAVALLSAACGQAPSALSGGGPQAGHWQEFPAPLAAAMQRGVNVSNWFQHRSDPAAAPGWPLAQDFEHMRALGLGHVRLLVDPAWLQHQTANAGALRAGVELALAADLVVVLALQPSSEIKLSLGDGQAGLDDLALTWRMIAVLLGDLAPDRLVFEVLNEPEIEDAARAAVVQEHLIEAVRASGPKRWAVINGAHYSDIDDLLALPAPRLAGVIYGFHFYTPHNFTHQGATWGWPMWALLRDLPYPSSPELLEPMLPTLPEPAREHAAWYGQQAWNRQALAPGLERAADWARRHRVPLWCSEFGVLRDTAPPDSRRAWLGDVRDLFERHHIAWSHFDWWGHFGLVTGPPRARVEDADALAGLGLVRRP